MSKPKIFKRKRPDGSEYPFWYTLINGRPRSTGRRDKRAAEAQARRLERAAADPTLRAARTFGELCAAKIEEDFDRVQAGRLRASTANFYHEQIGYLLKRIPPETSLEELPALVDGFVHRRLTVDGVKPYTVHKQLTVLGQLGRLARHLGWWSGTVEQLRPRNWRPQYKPGDRWLTEDEALALLRALNPHRRGQVAFVLATGARFEESACAQPGDIDGAREIVDLRGTKTEGAERDVPVLPYAWPLVATAIQEIPFKRWTSSNRSRDLRAACRRAGVEPCNFHDLRRTAAWWAARRTGQYALVARFLGHSTPAMAMRVYAKLDGETLRDAMRKNL